MYTPTSRQSAIEQVTLLTQPTEFPVVHADVVGALVDQAARIDADGNLPSDDDWTPTYDLNSAAASVFEVKAALVVNKYDTNTDGQSLSRSQLLAHLMTMAKMYRNRRTSSRLRKDAPGSGEESPSVEEFL